jgi:hypothetical protein
MASIENRVLELEDEYTRIETAFREYIGSLWQNSTSSIGYEEDLQKLRGTLAGFRDVLSMTLNLQRN